jgi:hypothetical protein
VVANEIQKAVGQLAGLRKPTIHLAETIELFLCLRSQLLLSGPLSTR